MDRLEGKTAVVTGAASGIGRALVDRFVRAGMRVVLADVEQEPLDAAVDELRARGGEVLGVLTDVSDAEQVERLATAALGRFGRVNVVSNNAGVGLAGPASELAINDWRWVLGVNLWGVIHGIRAFLPHLLAHGDGHIVNTASVAGVTSHAGLAAYTTSKHAVVGLSEVLYKELAAQGSGVGVSLLIPGRVATRIAESERNRPEHLARAACGEQVADRPSHDLSLAKAPAEVADLVHDAILSGKFYVFTDSTFTAAVRERCEDIQLARNPSVAPRRSVSDTGGEA